MAFLILVKHSLPEIDPHTRPHRWRLSETGRQRCLPLAEMLAPFKPVRLVSSQEPKAIETARLAGRFLNIPWHSAPGLQEHARYTTVFENPQEFQASIARLFTQPDRLVYGEETADQASQRFAQAVAQVIEANPDQTQAIVAHGTVISLFVGRFCSLDSYSLWKRLGLPSFLVLTLPEIAIQMEVDQIL